MLSSPERASLYEALAARIGNTPLVPVTDVLANNCRLFVKQEFANAVGESHYDRVYLALFRAKEEAGLIRPGMNVFETTSGTAGVSFSAIGTALGYHCHVAIPAGGEKAREDAVMNAGGQIYLTPQSDYVNGFPEFILRFKQKNRNYVFMNHSRGDLRGRGPGVNRVAVEAMYDIADEAMQTIGPKQPRHMISVLGNGTNTLGLAERLSKVSPVTEITAIEMASSGVGYRQKYGEGAYRELMSGVEPQDFSRHSMPGTSYPGIECPALQEAMPKVARVVLVADEKTEAEYHRLTGKDLSDQIVRFRHATANPDLAIYGRSTRASIAVAQHLASRSQQKTFVVIGYDKSDRYDAQPEMSALLSTPRTARTAAPVPGRSGA